MTKTIHDTLGNLPWLRANEAGIKALLPDTWTPVINLDGVRLGYGLKLLGVPWSGQEEFGKILFFLEHMGFLERNGLTVKKNPHSIFKITESKV